MCVCVVVLLLLVAVVVAAALVVVCETVSPSTVKRNSLEKVSHLVWRTREKEF